MKTSIKTMTKNIATTLCVSTVLFAPIGGVALANELKVTFKHIEKHKGNLMVALFNSKESYSGKSAALQTAQIPVNADSVTYTFTELDDGQYAIKLFHDENDNGKMDTNLFGIPSEGYGFSNNVGKFGEPEFRKAAFDLKDKAEIEIIVR
jgi:uncharacterized protein (DUF2141 family)